MIYLYKLFIPSLFIILALTITCCQPHKDQTSPALKPVKNTEDVPRLFPKTPQEITQRTTWAMNHAQQELEKLISIPSAKRTFKNTAQAFDTIVANFSSDSHIISGLIYVHPDQKMRDTAQDEVIKLQEFAVDKFG